MRAIWKGSLSFGLVSIPVSLYPAEGPEGAVHFHLLDGRTMEPVKQKRVNGRTGEEVPAEDIVKGYEYEPGRWIVLTEDEIREALPTSTQTIDIAEFVEESAIDSMHYARPYYLEPQPSGRKAYALLREVMRTGGRVAIGRVVIRTRRYVAAISSQGPALVMSLLRYAHELRDPTELDLPAQDLAAAGVTDKELAMAEQLVGTMVETWDPAAFADDYFERVTELIRMKAETGEVTAIEPAPAPVAPGEVVDIMALLKRSLERSSETPATSAAGA